MTTCVTLLDEVKLVADTRAPPMSSACVSPPPRASLSYLLSVPYLPHLALDVAKDVLRVTIALEAVRNAKAAATVPIVAAFRLPYCIDEGSVTASFGRKAAALTVVFTAAPLSAL